MQGRKYFLNAQKGEFSESRQISNRHTFKQITGHIVGITFKDTSYGETMRVQVIDETNFYCISMFVSSRPANGFFVMAKNIDLQHEVTIKIHAENGKDFLNIEQYGSPVQWYYNRDNSHELPSDFDERRAFYRSIIVDEIIPAVQKKLNPYPSNPFYSPKAKGLQGGYFDKQESNARFPKSVGSVEQKFYDDGGKW